MESRIRYLCASHVGKVRRVNQDNYICALSYMKDHARPPAFPIEGTVPQGLFGVFDGMGGEERGETAALLAAQTAAQAVQWDAQALADICHTANARVCAAITEMGLSSMGTTASLLGFGPRDAAMCAVGDSRIYRFRRGELEQLSTDDWAPSPYGQKPPLSQCLGIPPDEMLIQPHTATFPLKRGDLYLICSDGLTDMVPDEQIGLTLGGSAPLSKKGMALIDMALQAGGYDNVTVILCLVEEMRESLPGRIRQLFAKGASAR